MMAYEILGFYVGLGGIGLIIFGALLTAGLIRDWDAGVPFFSAMALSSFIVLVTSLALEGAVESRGCKTISGEIVNNLCIVDGKIVPVPKNIKL